MGMYRSPIEIIYGQMQTQIEGDIYRAVASYYPNVDKEELLRALKYDRDQYHKGYADGRRDAMDELVKCKECSHCAYPDSNNLEYGYCGVVHLYVKPNDFCSQGERICNGQTLD